MARVSSSRSAAAKTRDRTGEGPTRIGTWTDTARRLASSAPGSGRLNCAASGSGAAFRFTLAPSGVVAGRGGTGQAAPASAAFNLVDGHSFGSNTGRGTGRSYAGP